MTQFHRKGNTECHRRYHQKGIDSSYNTYLYIIVEHIVDKVNQRNTRYDEQGTSQQRVPRSSGPLCRKQCRCPRQNSRYKGSNRNTHIMIQTGLVAFGTHTHTNNGCNGSIKESHPVATELNTESTAGKTGTDGYLPGSIITLLGTDFLQFFFVTVE